MPMVAREPGPHPTVVPRFGSEMAIGPALPLADLLPSGGAPAPAPTPDRALALDALRLLRGLRDPVHRTGRWSDPAFAREVELVRCQLAPLRGRTALKASFGREAFQALGSRDGPGEGSLGPVRVAYALRWLELGDRLVRPSWLLLLERHRR